MSSATWEQYFDPREITLTNKQTHQSDTILVYEYNDKSVRKLPTGLPMPPTNSLQMTFRGCSLLTDISALAKWDTSKVTSLDGIFWDCTRLQDISALASWDTTNVQFMSNVFNNCNSISDFTPISKWNTSRVTSMRFTFCRCWGLTDANAFADWDVSNAKNIEAMFSYCIKLTDIDALANWHTEGILSFNRVFKKCTTLAEIYPLYNWHVSSRASFTSIFEECTSMSPKIQRIGNRTEFIEMLKKIWASIETSSNVEQAEESDNELPIVEERVTANPTKEEQAPSTPSFDEQAATAPPKITAVEETKAIPFRPTNRTMDNTEYERELEKARQSADKMLIACNSEISRLKIENDRLRSTVTHLLQHHISEYDPGNDDMGTAVTSELQEKVAMLESKVAEFSSLESKYARQRKGDLELIDSLSSEVDRLESTVSELRKQIREKDIELRRLSK